MNDKDLDYLKEILIALAVGVLCYVISSLEFNNGNITVSFSIWPDAILFILFGFLHAYNVWDYEHALTNDRNIIKLVAYTFTYAAFYKVVIFPTSGFGIIEWIFIFGVLGSNWLMDIYPKGEKMLGSFIGLHPVTLLFFGFILLILKAAVFQLCGSDIYAELVHGNTFMQYAIVGVCLCAAILGFVQLLKLIKSKSNPEKKFTGSNFISKAFAGIGNFIVGGIKKIISLFEGPTVIIVIAIVIVLAAGSIVVYAFFKMKELFNDILKAVDTIVSPFLTTGENKVNPSPTYYICQTFSFMIILFYTSYLETELRRQKLLIGKKNMEGEHIDVK